MTLNNKFKEVYDLYKSRIENISDESQKKELSSMLLEIARNVSVIDKAHEDLLYGKKNSLNSLTEKRHNIAVLRKHLEQKLTALNV